MASIWAGGGRQDVNSSYSMVAMTSHPSARWVAMEFSIRSRAPGRVPHRAEPA